MWVSADQVMVSNNQLSGSNFLLFRNLFSPNGEYCREKKKECNSHYCWEKIKRGELDMERVRWDG